LRSCPKPTAQKNIARFQKGDSLQYQAALAELTTHAALKRQAYNVRLHPTCGHQTRKPDFEVQNAETKPVAIVEVTTFSPAADEVAQGKRDARVGGQPSLASVCYGRLRVKRCRHNGCGGGGDKSEDQSS
jgi:hypothetical protein